MYIIPSPTMTVIGNLQWYLTSDILQYIHQLRNDVLNGQQIPIQHLRVNSTSTTMIFSAHQRFPEAKTYVCEGIGFWNKRLQLLQFYASKLTHQSHCSTNPPDTTSADDVEHLLFRIIDGSLQAYEDAEDFIDRQTFEDRYGLRWWTQPCQTNSEKFK
ncbi:hypothetical protein BCR42DRAFT_388367 [Absidia repens]|uniref:Uncharacterized protein n=1 Tax=Absidia repens TaxID=90262 RepID=A0A1X2ITN8_9FUNG|nr:hypothetical protein BCR42DRAFT_388367 [Absidia repens]